MGVKIRPSTQLKLKLNLYLYSSVYLYFDNSIIVNLNLYLYSSLYLYFDNFIIVNLNFKHILKQYRKMLLDLQSEKVNKMRISVPQVPSGAGQ